MTPQDFNYLLGFTLADGHIRPEKSSGNPCLRLMSTDLQIIESLARLINGNVKPMKRGKNWPDHYKTCYSVQKTDQLAKDLMVRGLVTRKAYEQGAVRFDEEYFGDFLRGFCDGDGCIGQTCKGTLNLQFAGGVNLLSWLREVLNQRGYTIHYRSMVKYGFNHWAKLDCSGRNALPIVELMYGGKPSLVLGRKMELASKYVSSGTS